MPATLTIGQLSTAKQMCGYLMPALPLNSACAACGNAGQESSFNPTILGDGGVSYGLWQWQGSRLTGPNGLRAWCAANNLDPASIQGQCAFFVHELPTADGMGDKAAWITDKSNGGQPTRSLETLTADICTYYERPSQPDLENRISYAQQVAKFMGAVVTPAPTPMPPLVPAPAPAPAPWPTPVPGVSTLNPVLVALVTALAPAIESLATGLAAGLIKALIAQTAGTVVVTTTTPVVTAPVPAPAPAPVIDLNSLASTLVPLLLNPLAGSLAGSLPGLIAAELAKIIPQITIGTKP